MSRFYSFFFGLFVLLGTTGAQQYELAALNQFKYLVVKPNNTHIDYSEQLKEAIETKLKSRGFLRILDQSALFSSEYQQCDIVTCEFNMVNMSSSSPEIMTELNFYDCNYVRVYGSKDRNKYQFFSKSNVVKQINRHLAVFDNYTYNHQPKAEKPVAKEEVKPAEKAVESLPPTAAAAAEVGKFYALLIGISDYIDPAIPDLDNLPVGDAEKLAAVLESNYTFNKEDISILRNPTRRDIVIALDNISKIAGANDNVLLFYAGHGHYEEDNQIGYWLPRDAETENTSNWLYNDQLVASLKKIKSKHTLLISDACFSGSIFKSRAINLSGAGDALKKKYELPSRKAITSGTLKTVPNVSVFMKYLVDRLSHNPEDFFSASQLFQSIEIPVGNNSPTTPQYGVIQNVGDEGGDFIFIRKK